MEKIQHVISVPIMADLKTTPGNLNSVALLLGKTTVGDGQGGLYRWNTGAASDSLTYMDTVTVTGNTTGYWQRIYLATKVYPHGILVSNGGVKIFFISGTTDSSGEITLNLTTDNTTNGTAIFTEIWSINPNPSTNAASPANAVQSYRKSLSANLKQTVYGFYKANAVTITLGLVYSPFASIGTGTTVQFRIEGV